MSECVSECAHVCLRIIPSTHTQGVSAGMRVYVCYDICVYVYIGIGVFVSVFVCVCVRVCVCM